MVDPVSVVSAAIVSGDLIIGLSDGGIINAGRVQGPQGLDGPPGPTGANGFAGIDGNTIRTSQGRPAADLGNEGDFAVNTVDIEIFGPKMNNGWGNGTPLRGRVSEAEKEYRNDDERELFGMAPTGTPSGGVTSVSTTAPIDNTGSATQPNIGITAATTSAAGSMSAADKTKLDGLTPGGGTVLIGTVPIDADLGAGDNWTISITPATTSIAGSMSAADKTKLDGLGPVTTPNLQAVTDEGNITTREIKVDSVTASTSLSAGNPLGTPNWEVTEQGDQASKGNIFFELDRTASIYAVGASTPQLDLGTALNQTALGASISMRSGSHTHLLDQHLNLDRSGSQFFDVYGAISKSLVFRTTDNDNSTLVNVFTITGGGTGLKIQRDYQQSTGNQTFTSGQTQYIQAYGGADKTLAIRVGTTGAGDLLDKAGFTNAAVNFYGLTNIQSQSGTYENLKIDDDGTLWGRDGFVPTVDRQIANKKYVDDTVSSATFALEDAHVVKNLHFDDGDAEQEISFGGHLNKKLIVKSGSPSIPDAQHKTLLTYDVDKVRYDIKSMHYRPTHWGTTSSGDDWTILGRLVNNGADNEKMLTVHRGIGGDSVRYTGRKDDSSHALATQEDITALKSTIHAAVSTATDFDSLKAALLAALA